MKSSLTYNFRLPSLARFFRFISLTGTLAVVPCVHAQHRLTEFLAINNTGITDEDGTRQPWIEIWNSNQTSVVQMTNFKLANTRPSTGLTTTWTIPSIQLMPDERIIIWASGKNRSVVTAQLHTNFVLSAEAGSTLSLLNSANTPLTTFAAYPAQNGDISWGRDDADTAVTPTLVGTYITPTPLEKNSTYTGSGVAGGVVFSETSRAFNTTNADALLTLSLTQAAPDPLAEIRYTTSFSNLTATRQMHSATVLSNGQVLVAGGISTANLATCEIFDPAATSWLPAPNMATARRLHTATLLPNGKVLVVGGLGGSALASAELYDPVAKTWSTAGSLATARQLHTATLLNNGKVLITGGLGAAAIASAELYDPATNTWSATASLTTGRQLHTATLLADGKVFVTGGLGGAVLNSSEIYDPATGTWAGAAALSTARQQHSATLLGTGKLLVVGGFGTSAINSAELYDPALNTWSSAGTLTTARRLHTAVLLPGGKVLVTGGTAAATIPASSSLSTSQIYDPALNTWASATSMAVGRNQHTATLLPNDRVVVIGGSTSGTALATAELYNPAANTPWISSPRGAADLPDANSMVYTGPLTISTTQMVRARVFRTGKLPGATAAHTYLKLETNARAFSSAMPIVVITSFGQTPPDDGDMPSFMWVWEPAGPDNRARFTNAPVIAARTVIDKRGSSTLGNPKFNLNLESRQPFDEEEQDVSLLGMPAHSDWVFHAPYDFDRSLLHNPLIYAMSNAIGRYAVRNRMAEVFVEASGLGLNFTNTSSGDYFGVYNVMEKIRRNKDRVAISKLETYDNDLTARTGGYIFKVDRLDAGDSGFSAGGQTMAYYYPKERDLKSPQRDPQEQFLTSYVNTFNTRLQAANFADPTLGYASHLNVPAAIDHHLLNVWSFNVDALRLSGFWTKDRNGKMFPGPIWDFDRAMSSTDGRDANPNVWRSQTGDLGTDFFHYTWWNRLFRDPNFYQQYIDRWQELRAGPLSRTNLEALIDSLNAEISAEAISRDLARWARDKRTWTRPFAAPENNFMAASQNAEVQRLKDYLRQRANFMDTQWVGRVTASVPGGYVPSGTVVELSGPAGIPIYYTLDGSDPRPSGADAPPAGGTALYTGPITITANAKLRARAYKSNHTALTHNSTNNPPLASKWGGQAYAVYNIAPVIISELHYHPANPTAAELLINPAFVDNDFEFLELRNTGAQAVDLTGARFTSGITFEFTDAAARTIGPGESLIVASNPAAFAARYGATPVVSGPWGGNLSNSGETVTLVDASGNVIISVTYTDAWFPETDGPGYSLVAAQTYPGDFSMGSAWRASAASGGSPGAWDAASLPVSAGPDLTLSMAGGPFTLQGSLPGVVPPATGTAAWSMVSGPGVLTFGDSSQPATTVTASKAGAYVLRLSLTYNAATTYDEVTLTFVDSLAAFLARYPGIGAATDDFDKDGRTNFLEYALLTDPLVSTGSAPPAVSVVANKLTLEWTRHRPAGGVTYQIEVHDANGNFRPANAGEFTETIIAEDAATQTVRTTDTVELGTPVRRFIRIKATAVP